MRISINNYKLKINYNNYKVKINFNNYKVKINYNSYKVRISFKILNLIMIPNNIYSMIENIMKKYCKKN